VEVPQNGQNFFPPPAAPPPPPPPPPEKEDGAEESFPGAFLAGDEAAENELEEVGVGLLLNDEDFAAELSLKE